MHSQSCACWAHFPAGADRVPPPQANPGPQSPRWRRPLHGFASGSFSLMRIVGSASTKWSNSAESSWPRSWRKRFSGTSPVTPSDLVLVKAFCDRRAPVLASPPSSTPSILPPGHLLALYLAPSPLPGHLFLTFPLPPSPLPAPGRPSDEASRRLSSSGEGPGAAP